MTVGAQSSFLKLNNCTVMRIFIVSLESLAFLDGVKVKVTMINRSYNLDSER